MIKKTFSLVLAFVTFISTIEIVISRNYCSKKKEFSWSFIGNKGCCCKKSHDLKYIENNFWQTNTIRKNSCCNKSGSNNSHNPLSQAIPLKIKNNTNPLVNNTCCFQHELKLQINEKNYIPSELSQLSSFLKIHFNSYYFSGFNKCFNELIKYIHFIHSPPSATVSLTILLKVLRI